MSEEPKPDVKPDVPGGAGSSAEHINLKVTGQDGTVVHFKIKKNTPFRKLITAYCERQGIQKSTVRFTFDGNFVGEEQTPHDLDMEDEDSIEVFQSMTGGGGCGP